jgi:hypothetical protein
MKTLTVPLTHTTPHCCLAAARHLADDSARQLASLTLQFRGDVAAGYAIEGSMRDVDSDLVVVKGED